MKSDAAQRHHTLTDQALRLAARFNELYPEPRSELNFSSPYQLVVSVALSAQCTDKKVNEVTPILFAAYNCFAALATATESDIAAIIRPVNYYRTKAKHLRLMAAKVMSDFGGSLPTSYEQLLTLPGVGNKTANVLLCELGTATAFPVDTHVFRVSQRLGLARGKTPEIIEAKLRKVIPEPLWRNFHHWLIFHGRRVCKAQRPNCALCTLRAECRFREKTG